MNCSLILKHITTVETLIMLEHTLKRGQYEWSLRRWWSRPRSKVHKINLCRGLGAWPQENFEFEKLWDHILGYLLYCIFADETKNSSCSFRKRCNHHCSYVTALLEYLDQTLAKLILAKIHLPIRGFLKPL